VQIDSEQFNVGRHVSIMRQGVPLGKPETACRRVSCQAIDLVTPD
jgi:hypothetical protein